MIYTMTHVAHDDITIITVSIVTRVKVTKVVHHGHQVADSAELGTGSTIYEESARLQRVKVVTAR